MVAVVVEEEVEEDVVVAVEAAASRVGAESGAPVVGTHGDVSRWDGLNGATSRSHGLQLVWRYKRIANRNQILCRCSCFQGTNSRRPGAAATVGAAVGAAAPAWLQNIRSARRTRQWCGCKGG